MQPHLEELALRLLKLGAPIHKLAFRLGIDAEELRNFQVWETLHELAKSGRDLRATIFWLKTRAGADTKPPKPEPEWGQYRSTTPPKFVIVDKNGIPYPDQPK